MDKEIIEVLKKPLKDMNWLIEIDNGSKEDLEDHNVVCLKVQGSNSSGWIAFKVNDDFSIHESAKRLYDSLEVEETEYFIFEKIYAECYYVLSLSKFIVEGTLKYERGE